MDQELIIDLEKYLLSYKSKVERANWYEPYASYFGPRNVAVTLNDEGRKYEPDEEWDS